MTRPAEIPWQEPPSFISEDSLQNLFRTLHSTLLDVEAPECQIDFYPYAGLKHTIRSRNGRILVRLSDLLQRAPLEALEATLGLLICRLYSVEPPEDLVETYVYYGSSEEVRRAALKARADRGRKQLTKPEGKTYNLRRLFDCLNDEYFGGQLEVKHVSWSPGQSKRVLGHYDRAHDAIVLNRLLDHRAVPEFVVKYVLYHEMLHAALGEEHSGARRKIHHQRFRRAEQEFADYSRARRFIHEKLC